jgi:hypothetical protein
MRRLLPDAALLHQRHLFVDDVALVVGVLAGDFVEVAVLRIDRLLVDDLREFAEFASHFALSHGGDCVFICF